MMLLGLLSEANKDLAKEVDWGVCSDLLMDNNLKKYVIGAEEATALRRAGC